MSVRKEKSSEYIHEDIYICTIYRNYTYISINDKMVGKSLVTRMAIRKI